jgi:hypothetical protein
MYKSDPTTLELVRVDAAATGSESEYRNVSKKQAVTKEIVETEKTYCNDLNVLIKVKV